MVSSLGSYLSVVAVALFIVIILERFVSKRYAMFSERFSGSLEWAHPYPPADHSYSDTPILNNFQNGRVMRQS